MEKKRQVLPLPPTPQRLQQVVSMLLQLPAMLELKVTSTGIIVERGIDDGPVVPETIVEIAKGVVPDEPPLSVLLTSVTLDTLPIDRDRHQLTTLLEMTSRVYKKGLYPSGWYVAEGDGLDAFLAQAKGTLSPFLLGVPVHYVPHEELPPGSLVLMASSTRFSIDATYGVTADIGG